MEPTRPLVSIVIPCLRERKHIGAALESILLQDYPRERLEVLVVDGMSEDGTREIVQDISLHHPHIRLLDNPKRVTPAALNVGIQGARGEVIVRMDAHTTYETDYVTRCVRALSESNADVVGGIWKVVPEEDSLLGRAIALALSDSFGVGNAHYRTGHTTEPRQVDAVPFGSYRRHLFERVGLFDESVPRSEDADLYRRVRAAGGKILLVPTIVAYYRARSSLLAFLRHTLQNGFLVTYYLKTRRVTFFGRHLVPLAFVSTVVALAALALVHSAFLWPLAAVLASHSLANLLASFRVAAAQKNARYMAIMLAVFAALHWCYGLGAAWGLVRALTSTSLWRRSPAGRRAHGG
ncbi:MAG: putative Succinoglycan biosynthesis protein ExoA [Dehalococcoidia bacterium]|nr:putative Succinoglycan biosynthesis protein ExoA [Dehalococcoidia bacterium]